MTEVVTAPRPESSAGVERSGEHAGLVGAFLLVHDHGEPAGRVDQGDQADQRGDLVVVVCLGTWPQVWSDTP